MSKRYFAILSLSLAATAGAQAPIPVRTIGPILATSTENVGQAVSVRATSNGRLIVGAGSRQRVYVFDSTLKNFRTSSASLTRIATNLDSTTKKVNALVGGIERGEGTVGKFMKDTLLYRDLRGLVTQADSVLADLKANPKKYINLRIF